MVAANVRCAENVSNLHADCLEGEDVCRNFIPQEFPTGIATLCQMNRFYKQVVVFLK